MPAPEQVVRLQQRRTTLAAASATPVTGWALVDHHGTASVTIFPLAIGPQPFVLIVGGLPRLGHDPFTWLIGALSRRYDLCDWTGVATTTLLTAADHKDGARWA